MVFMYSEENFWLTKKVKVLLQVKKKKKKKRKRKKKKGKSETVRRMRKYEKPQNGERYKAQRERISFVLWYR